MIEKITCFYLIHNRRLVLLQSYKYTKLIIIFCIFAALNSPFLNIKIFITLHLLEKRQKNFGSTLRTALLFPLAIVGDFCLCIAISAGLVVAYFTEKYEN